MGDEYSESMDVDTSESVDTSEPMDSDESIDTSEPVEEAPEAVEEDSEVPEEVPEEVEEDPEAFSEDTEAAEEVPEEAEDASEAFSEDTEAAEEVPEGGQETSSEASDEDFSEAPEAFSEDTEVAEEVPEEAEEAPEAFSEDTEVAEEVPAEAEEASEAFSEDTEAAEEVPAEAEEASEAFSEDTEAAEEVPTEAEQASEAPEAAEETSEADTELPEDTEQASEAVEEPTDSGEELPDTTEEAPEAVEETGEADTELPEDTEQASEAVEEPTDSGEELPDATEEASEAVEETSEAETELPTEQEEASEAVEEPTDSGEELPAGGQETSSEASDEDFSEAPEADKETSEADTELPHDVMGASEASDTYQIPSNNDARTVLRPTDAAYAPEGTANPLDVSKKEPNDLTEDDYARKKLADYKQDDVNHMNFFNPERYRQMNDISNTCDDLMDKGLKFEDFSKSDYEALNKTNPIAANKLMADYVDRNSARYDLAAMDATEGGRKLDLASGQYEVMDDTMTPESAILKDVNSGQEFIAYPNPLTRRADYDIQQGNNSLGMQQDCGLASSVQAINDIYGKKIASEDYNTALANRMANFSYEPEYVRDQNGNPVIDENGQPLISGIDWSNSGGTIGENVQAMFDAYNIPSDHYRGSEMLSMEDIAGCLQRGDSVELAVNAQLLWDEGDPRTQPGFYQGMDDAEKAQWQMGIARTNHFINVYGACHDTNTGQLTGFLIKDTGAGENRMISLDALRRATFGGDGFYVPSTECVVAHERRQA